MNAYFFKMTNEEKNNILNQHKEVYDGYATNNVTSNTQPLYVQDFANDKEGITVNNKGSVTTYKNMNINEDVYSGSAGSGMLEPEESFESEEENYEDSYMVSLGEKLDMIGDGPNDLPNGTIDPDSIEDETQFLIEPDDFSDEDGSPFSRQRRFFDDEDLTDNEDGPEFDLGGLFKDEDFDEDEVYKISDQITESLKMFNRLKNI